MSAPTLAASGGIQARSLRSERISDFQGTSNNGCRACVVNGVAPIDATGLNMLTTQTVDRRMDYFGTSRVHAGFLVTTRLLLYGTGGLAYGQIKTTSLITTSVTGVPAGVVVPGTSSYADRRIQAGRRNGMDVPAKLVRESRGSVL
jgi:opacity protein-like surface antigen